MAKFTLELEENYDFRLLSIFSHVRDYRLSWEINQGFYFDLQKDDNLTIRFRGNEQEHSLYSYQDDDNLVDYYLIGNRGELGWLIPEEKCDYFLLIKGQVREEDFSEFVKQLNQLKHVLATSELQVDTLKSKENLIF